MEEDDLLQLKKDIEVAKIKGAETKGKLETLLQVLKKDFNCATVADAEDKLKVIHKEIEQLRSTINSNIKEIESKYELD